MYFAMLLPNEKSTFGHAIKEKFEFCKNYKATIEK